MTTQCHTHHAGMVGTVHLSVNTPCLVRSCWLVMWQDESSFARPHNLAFSNLDKNMLASVVFGVCLAALALGSGADGAELDFRSVRLRTSKDQYGE
jgi:hypothetical protein